MRPKCAKISLVMMHATVGRALIFKLYMISCQAVLSKTVRRMSLNASRNAKTRSVIATEDKGRHFLFMLNATRYKIH